MNPSFLTQPTRVRAKQRNSQKTRNTPDAENRRNDTKNSNIFLRPYIKQGLHSISRPNRLDKLKIQQIQSGNKFTTMAILFNE